MTDQPGTERTLEDRLRDAAEVLEQIAADRSVLTHLADADRDRLLRAIASAYSPDRYERRRMVKTAAREQRAARTRRDDQVLARSAIRSLHRKAPINTPNVFPPQAFLPHDAHAETEPVAEPPARESLDPRYCYVCKEPYTTIHHFYDQLCPACADRQLREADGAGRSARTRRAAHGRSRQDRLPDRAEAPSIAAPI